jgi:type III secretion protein J
VRAKNPSVPRLYTLCVVLCACSTEIAQGLDEAQSQEALAALSEAGIPAERVGHGEGADRHYRIDVPSGDGAQATGVLLAEGLPRAKDGGFHQIYSTASMIPSPTEEKARFLDALGGEIAAHLGGLPGVSKASVIVTSPAVDPFADRQVEKPRPTASVLLTLRDRAPAPSEDDVKKLVAGAVEGMVTSDVAVVTTATSRGTKTSEAFYRVGPIRVARASRGALLGLLGGSLGLVIVMGVWVVSTERRMAALRAHNDARPGA